MMSRKLAIGIAAGAIGLLLLLGIARAVTGGYARLKALLSGGGAEAQPAAAPASTSSSTGYAAQVKAFLAASEAARRSGGAADYPTPEIKLERAARTLPGGTAEVAAKGSKWPPGAKLLFDNDAVRVLKESQAGDTYRATVQVSNLAGPGVAHLVLLEPGGRKGGLPAVWIGGKYGWEFAASNGWRIKMALLDERADADSVRRFVEDSERGVPHSFYRAEFYRGSEGQPFKVRDVELSYSTEEGNAWYSGGLKLTQADQAEMEKRSEAWMKSQMADTAAQAERTKLQEEYGKRIEKLSEKISDPNLSEAERNKIGEEFKKVMAEGEAKFKAMAPQSPGDKEQADFGCDSISFALMEGKVSKAELRCITEGKGRSIELTGTMKFLGP